MISCRGFHGLDSAKGSHVESKIPSKSQEKLGTFPKTGPSMTDMWVTSEEPHIMIVGGHDAALLMLGARFLETKQISTRL
jgi:hypothetical protein